MVIQHSQRTSIFAEKKLKKFSIIKKQAVANSTRLAFIIIQIIKLDIFYYFNLKYYLINLNKKSATPITVNPFSSNVSFIGLLITITFLI